MRRNEPPFRADHVGSLLRPQHLMRSRKDHEEGRLSTEGNDLTHDEQRAKLELIVETVEEIWG